MLGGMGGPLWPVGRAARDLRCCLRRGRARETITGGGREGLKSVRASALGSLGDRETVAGDAPRLKIGCAPESSITPSGAGRSGLTLWR